MSRCTVRRRGFALPSGARPARRWTQGPPSARYLCASFLKGQEISTTTMTTLANITFQKPGRKPAGTLIVLAGEDLQLGPQARELAVGALIARAAAAASFKGKAMTTLDLYAPAETDLDRLVVLCCGQMGDVKEQDWLR